MTKEVNSPFNFFLCILPDSIFSTEFFHVVYQGYNTECLIGSDMESVFHSLAQPAALDINLVG